MTTSSSAAAPRRSLGFYAMVPRLIRTSPTYRDLTHAEKWLYVCLKDLCGDSGMCFRTLLSLSRETDFSTGALSQMIRRLHSYGLVHAEKKRRGDAGHELWHISIVDLWGANARTCGEKPTPPEHSGNEQSGEDASENERSDDADADSLHDMNDMLHDMNKTDQKRSENEVIRSRIGDRRRTREEQPSLSRTSEESIAPQSVADGLGSGNEEIWTVEAILNLAAQYLPELPTHISKKQQTENETQWRQAAEDILEASLFRLMGPEGAIEHLVHLLQSVSDPTSSSWWMQTFTLEQGKDVRLWHLAKNHNAIGQDLLKTGWQPQGAVGPDETNHEQEEEPMYEADHDVEPVMTPEPLRTVELEQALAPVIVWSEEEYATISASIDADAPLYPEITAIEMRGDGVIEVMWTSAWAGTPYASEVAAPSDWPMLLVRIAHSRLSWRERLALQQQRKAG